MRYLIAVALFLVPSASGQSMAGCRSAVDQAKRCCSHPETCLSGAAQKAFLAAKTDDQEKLRQSTELQEVFTKQCESHIRDCHNRCDGVSRDDSSMLLKQCEGFADLAEQKTNSDRAPARAVPVLNPVPDAPQPDPVN